MMNNKASAAYVAAEVNHQAYKDERDAHLETMANEARLEARQNAADAMLEEIEAIAGFPIKGKIRRVRKVLRGDRR